MIILSCNPTSCTSLGAIEDDLTASEIDRVGATPRPYRWRQTVEDVAALTLGGDQTCIAQDAKMMREQRLVDPEFSLNLMHLLGSVDERTHHPEARRVAEDAQAVGAMVCFGITSQVGLPIITHENPFM